MLRLWARCQSQHLTRIARRYATQPLASFRLRLAESRHGPELSHDYFAIRNNTKDRESFSQQELIGAMATLSASDDPADLALVQQMFRDMPHFGFEQTPDHYIHAVKAMAKSSIAHPRSALDFIANSPSRIPVVPLWSALVREYERQSNVTALLVCVDASGMPLTFLELAYAALLGALTTASRRPSTQDLQAVLDEMKAKNVRVHPNIAHTLVKACRQQGIDPPQHLVNVAGSALKGMSREEWLQKLRTSMPYNKYFVLRNMQRDGYAPDASVLAAFLNTATSAAALAEAEVELRVKADASHWTTVIQNATQNGFASALVVYDHAKAAGIEPTADMVLPIVRCVLLGTLSAPSWKAVSQAMDLFRDLAHLHHRGDPDADARLHQLLIETLSASKHPRAAEYKQEILDAMEQHGIALSTDHAASLAMHAIYTARTHQEALDAFRAVRDANDLQYTDLIQVLRQICNLAYIDAPFIPPSVFFEFAREIVWMGYPLRMHVYFIIFARYCDIAKQVRFPQPQVSAAIHSAVREVYQRLLLDTFVPVDIALWSCIMYAFLWTQDHAQVVYIFNELLQRGARLSPSCVSVVFDACGHGRMLDEARAIHLRLLERGYQLNFRNRTAMLECLCRCDQLPAALDTVCDEEEDGTDEARRAASLLMKFAADGLHEKTVYDRLAERLPLTFASLGDERSRIARRAKRKGLLSVVKQTGSSPRDLGKWGRPSPRAQAGGKDDPQTNT